MNDKFKNYTAAACKAEITAPASKSYLQRALAIAALSDPAHTTEIEGFSASEDAEAALSAVDNLGAKIRRQKNIIQISGITSDNHLARLQCGEAGLCARMFAPVAAIFDRETHITGIGTLLNRPFVMVEDALRQLGKTVISNAGKLPMVFSGKLSHGKISIDGSESSQLLTGLLIALPCLSGDSEIIVRNLKSIPYIDMTLNILKHFGIEILHKNYEIFYVPGNRQPKAERYCVEGDWSGAAFLLVAGAIAGEISVTNLPENSLQADKAVLHALRECGANVNSDKNTVFVAKNNLNAFEFNAIHCPDLFPPLAVLAANCKGISRIKGVHRLLHKESNRSLAIREEWAKIGISVEIQGDEMLIEGGKIKGGTIFSHNDHRIAMSAAVLSLNAADAVGIEGADAVRKSYPNFYEDFEKLRRL